MKKKEEVKGPKMNARVKKSWLAALRSGKYKQARGALRELMEDDDDESGEGEPVVTGYCCLGVLCDLYAKSTPGRRRGHTWGEGWDGNLFLGEEGSLPDEVREWAGFPEEGDEGRFYRRTKNGSLETAQDVLVALNDSTKASFKKIAEWVEKNL